MVSEAEVGHPPPPQSPWEILSVLCSQDIVIGLVQDSSNSIANALELLQSCTKPSMWWSGPRFNIKMPCYQYRKSHCGDKTILRPSYLHNGISYTGKMASLYWIRALAVLDSWVSVAMIQSSLIVAHNRMLHKHNYTGVEPGPWFNIKMSSYQYRKPHCGDKTVVRSSYLRIGISYTGKMSSLYWIGALYDETGEVLLKRHKSCNLRSTVFSKIMFNLHVVKDHLSWETTTSSDRFIQVSL